jgi:hypothetical protein
MSVCAEQVFLTNDRTLYECGPAPDNPYYRAFLERSFENHVRQRDLRLICEMRMLETE